MSIDQKKLEQHLQDSISSFLSYDWSDQDFYSHWLAQTYYYVCHSTRIIALAASRFYLDRNALHLRFLEHISEESNHEKLAVNDLKSMDLRIEDLPELVTTKSFYQSQYYQIERCSPTALLGWIIALEGIAALGGERFQATLDKHYKPRATSFVRVHAEEDEGHLTDALNLVQNLPEHDQKLIYDNFLQSSAQYSLMLRECHEKAQKLKELSPSKAAA